MAKHEWRKHEKGLYIPKEKPEVLNVEEHKFITIEGKGNPNNQDFKDRIEALYSIAYAIKMMPKKGIVPEGYFDYTVYPLEGIWDLENAPKDVKAINKDELLYKIMIRQPDFVTDEVFDLAVDMTRKKKKSKLIDEVKLENIEDGLSVQMLHIGPYDNEYKTFEIMKEYMAENNLILSKWQHREIYLSDPRKVEPEKMKTVLRYTVNRED